jgi:hypothetical protein
VSDAYFRPDRCIVREYRNAAELSILKSATVYH